MSLFCVYETKSVGQGWDEKNKENKNDPGVPVLQRVNVLFTDLFVHLCICVSCYKNHTVIINIHSVVCSEGVCKHRFDMEGASFPFGTKRFRSLTKAVKLCYHTDESLWSVTNPETITSFGMSWNCPNGICLSCSSWRNVYEF